MTRHSTPTGAEPKPASQEEPDPGTEGQRPRVHPGAHVDPAAVLEDGVEIGPGAVVGPEVHLGRGVRVGPNAILAGKLTLGAGVRIFPGAVVGEEPQDL